MKSVFLLFLICLTFTVFSQTIPKDPKLKAVLMGQKWRSNINVFSSENTKRYLIYKNEESNPYSMWGNFISFTDSTFHTNYSASCGVDCFVTIDGNYKFVGSDKIEVFVKSIARSGFCHNESEKPKKSFGIYQIIRTPEGYEILKED